MDKKNMSNEEKLQYAIRRRRHLEALIYVDALTGGSNEVIPELTFSIDKKSSASKSLITIGVGGLNAATEDELFAQIVFMIGLQQQHLRSTVGRDWETCEKLALKKFCDRLSMDIYHRKGRFHKESDYKHFFKDLEADGIHLSVHTIKELVTYVAGCLEEGRVERIRAQKNPGFMDYRRVARGSNLINSPIFPEGVNPIAYDELNPAEHLKALQKQISFLATCEKFQYGFLRQYIATPFYDEVLKYCPLIWKAVTATTCKECMSYAIDILERMYERILEAAKYKGGIESMMKSLLEFQANAMDESTFDTSPAEEETGSGEKPEKLFDDSDLEVTLDDESYDKLMQQQGNGSQNDDGMKVKREHDYDENPFTQKPKPQQNQQNQQGNQNNSGQESNNSENGQKGNSASENQDSSSGSSASANGNSSNMASNMDSSSSMSPGSENGTSSDGSTSENSNTDTESGSAVDGSAEESKVEDGSGNDGSSAASGQTSNDDQELDEDSKEAGYGTAEDDNVQESSDAAESVSRNESDSEKTVEKASSAIKDTGVENSNLSAKEEMDNILKSMKEAAESIQPDISLADKEEKYEEEFRKKMEGFKTNPLAPTDTSGIDSKYSEPVHFKEMTRLYKPDLPLPFALQKKGSSLKRKMEEILRNKQQPDRRGMRSGSIDGTRLYKLISSETTCFKKRGEKNKPDVAGYLLMDNSGSMGNGTGSTRYHACKALSVIEEGFKEFMPLRIAAFDASSNDYVTHEIIKDFEEVCESNFTYNFYRQGRSGSGNKDGYSIRVATKQLLERPEKDKILIIASDGLPSCYCSTSGTEDVKAAVAEARSNGIKVIGMYMYSYADDKTFQAYHNMYAPDYLMVTMDQIESELTRIMKRLFTRK